jgi:hypothetical protein
VALPAGAELGDLPLQAPATRTLLSLRALGLSRPGRFDGNTAHSQKHSEDVVEHGQKLDDHLKKYPGAESAAAELLKVSPSQKAGPPKGAK